MQPRPTDPVNPSCRYDVDTAMAYLGISRSRFYAKVRAGELAIVRDGRRTFVCGAEIARLSQPQPSQQPRAA